MESGKSWSKAKPMNWEREVCRLMVSSAQENGCRRRGKMFVSLKNKSLIWLSQACFRVYWIYVYQLNGSCTCCKLTMPWHWDDRKISLKWYMLRTINDNYAYETEGHCNHTSIIMTKHLDCRNKLGFWHLFKIL